MEKYQTIKYLRRQYKDALICVPFEEQLLITKAIEKECEENGIDFDVILMWSNVFELMDIDFIIKKYTF